MTVYVRNRRKVKVKQGFQSRVGCVQRVRAHIDSSQFSYEQGAVVRHAVRSTTIRSTADVAYIPVVSVIEEVTCGCSDCFGPEDLSDRAEAAMLDCIKRVLRPHAVPESVHDCLSRCLEELCSGNC